MLQSASPFQWWCTCFCRIFIPLFFAECQAGQFQCSNGRCVSLVLLLDGNDDCKDNSDEESVITDGEREGKTCFDSVYTHKSNSCMRCSDSLAWFTNVIFLFCILVCKPIFDEHEKIVRTANKTRDISWTDGRKMSQHLLKDGGGERSRVSNFKTRKLSRIAFWKWRKGQRPFPHCQLPDELQSKKENTQRSRGTILSVLLWVLRVCC